MLPKYEKNQKILKILMPLICKGSLQINIKDECLLKIFTYEDAQIIKHKKIFSCVSDQRNKS